MSVGEAKPRQKSPAMAREENDDGWHCMKLRANKGDKLHDLQLLHDLAIINACTLGELGSVPAGGLPAAPKRKPNLAAYTSMESPSLGADHKEKEMMDFKPLAVVAGMTLASCAPTGSPPHEVRSPQAVESEMSGSPMQSHKFRLNPNPKQGYEITVSIKDAPGPFDHVSFGAAYGADNCSYVISDFGGVRGNPEKSVEIRLKKLDGSTYVGTMYLDAMLDEDYYGNGVCHWRLTGVGAGLMATGAEVETRFSPSLDAQSILSQEVQTFYFRKENYPRDMIMDGFITSGQKNRAVFASKYKDDDLFTITLTAKEAP